MTQMTFEEKLRLLVRTGLGHEPRASGALETALRSIEVRLGVELPTPLRIFYTLAGETAEVMTSHHVFVPVEELVRQKDALVFCYENQRAMFWGVLWSTLRVPDPPVVQGQPGVDQWWDECRELSTFLLDFTCWQLVNAMPELAVAKVGDGTITKLRKSLAVVSASLHHNMATMASEENGILVSVLLDPELLYVGAQNETALVRFSRQVGIELDVL